MSWVDAMRLKRRAAVVRGTGWANLAVSLIACAADPEMLPILGTWGGGFMALSYGLGHAIEKRAERVVAR